MKYNTKKTAAGTVDTRYANEHCIMSYATSGSRFNRALLGQTMEMGPGLNGVYTNVLGGIPQSRLYKVPAVAAALTLKLAPLTHAEESGVLLIQIPPTQTRLKTYWVELHDNSNLDQAIPNSRIAVHETRVGDGRAYSLEVNGQQSLNSVADAAFITPDGSIGIRYVEKIGLNVWVRIWELGPTRSQQIRISTIVVNPPGDDVIGEKVVIRNDCPTKIPLYNWELRDNANHPVRGPWRFIFPNITIAPGEDITVWTGIGNDNSANLYWGLNHAVCNNSGGDAAAIAIFSAVRSAT